MVTVFGVLEFGVWSFGHLHFMLGRPVLISLRRPYLYRILVYRRKLGSAQGPIIRSTSFQLASISLRRTSMDENTPCQVIRTDDTVIHMIYDPRQPPSKPEGFQWTRFVCISDSHCATFPLPSGDVLIHAGDMTRNVRATTKTILNPA